MLSAKSEKVLMGIVSVAKLEVSEAEKNMLIMYANVSPIRTTVLLEISFG